MESRHASVVVHRPVEEVYAYAADADHLHLWGSGLAQAEVRRDGDDLLVDSPMGEVRVTFAAHNPYGVLDHRVTTPDGTTTYNPVRVVEHPEGSEVVFTVRQLALSDDELDRDVSTVQHDLETLRDLLER